METMSEEMPETEETFYNIECFFSFRRFFTHRFHPDIIEQTLAMLDILDNSVEGTEELQGDLVGVMIAAACSFYNNSDLEISVDEEVFTVFEQAVIDQAKKSNKHTRYLENADLHLEKIHVFQTSALEHSEFPSWQSVLASIDRSQPASNYPPPSFEEFLLLIPVPNRADVRSVYKSILFAGAHGATLSDIQNSTNMESHKVLSNIRCLTESNQVISVGVEVQRWVVAEFALAWCVKVGGRIVPPRPWTMPSGEICPATVRWMGESILMLVVSSPGITLKQVCFVLEYALQPIAVKELITVLGTAGCVRLVEEVFENAIISTLFQKDYESVTISYKLPVVDCLEKFSRIFGRICLLPGMSGRSEPDKQKVQRNSNHR